MQSQGLPSSFLIIDSASSVFRDDILFPFAFDEVMARKVGEGILPPIVHIWRHEKAFVLGLRDRRLPHALEAMGRLEQQGFSVTVRNSGGAAVPLDPGVINISLILPNPERNMDFHQDFELMYRLVQGSLHQLGSGVEKGEIVGSYCPGDFDLSVAGQKFCGIAQRRQTKAFAVQAFLVVEGKGEQRAKLVRDFYEHASGGKEDAIFPDVTLDRMASLSELMEIPSVEAFRQGLFHYLSQQGGTVASLTHLSDYFESIQAAIVDLRIRYEKRES